MSDGIGAKLFKVIASHGNIKGASEPDSRLLSGIAAPILIWLCTHKPQDGQLEDISPVPTSYLNTLSTTSLDTVRCLYEMGIYNGNRCMAESLFSMAISARNIGLAALFEQIADKKRKEAKTAKENKEAHANYTRETAFHRAAKDGDTDEVKKLLNNPEFDGNHADESGMTPLQHAAKHGHSAVVKLLLENLKIDRNSADKSGMAPLHHAVEGCCSAVVELLVADDKVKINKENCQGNTPLMLAVVNRSMQQSGDRENSYYDILDTMLGNPEAGIHAFNHQHHTPFSRAVQTGQGRVVKMFLEHQRLLDESETNRSRRHWQR